MLLTSNFTFLKAQDAQLAQLGALAERYFRDDPGTAVFKLRQFAELLSKTVAAHNALYLGERETFEETLRRLSYERIIPKEAADVFHALRKAGNKAAHETTGNHSDALLALKFARQLAIWFHRTYGKKSDFKPGPFVPCWRGSMKKCGRGQADDENRRYRLGSGISRDADERMAKTASCFSL
jgi:type I restriction enzyme R subunit